MRSSGSHFHSCQDRRSRIVRANSCAGAVLSTKASAPASRAVSII